MQLVVRRGLDGGRRRVGAAARRTGRRTSGRAPAGPTGAACAVRRSSSRPRAIRRRPSSGGLCRRRGGAAGRRAAAERVARYEHGAGRRGSPRRSRVRWRRQRAGAATHARARPQRATPNAVRPLAAFSSRGLAFDGLVDPELAAPGVELVSSVRGAPARLQRSSAARASRRRPSPAPRRCARRGRPGARRERDREFARRWRPGPGASGRRPAAWARSTSARVSRERGHGVLDLARLRRRAGVGLRPPRDDRAPQRLDPAPQLGVVTGAGCCAPSRRG